ncbi:MAG: lysophospholipid acyltransferase family protein [Dermatophilaceae bacterium]
MFYWFLKKVLLGPLLKLLFRPWVEGEENIPQTGAALLASNHLSFSDSIFLPVVAKRRITFPAKMEYFTGSGVKGRLTRWFFKGVGQIPIDRSGGRASEAAIESGLRVLRKGQLFGIYPEGTRSPDGRLYKGKTGMARMALEAGCPIIPVAMIGTDKAQPTGQKVPNITRIGIRIGRPLDFGRYEGMHNDRFVLRSITDEVMYELMLLSGQEYVDVYAGSLKKGVLQTALDRAREIQVGVKRSGDAVVAELEPAGAAVAVVDGGAGRASADPSLDVERRAS